MNDELEQIVQRMIDAGESEENIAAVIQGYQPQETEPETPTYTGGLESARGPSGQSIGQQLMGAAPELIAAAVLPGAGRLLAKGAGMLGRGAIRTAAAAGDMVHPDLIGIASPRLGRAVEAAQRIKAAMPQAAPAANPAPSAPIGAQKPKLSVQQVAEMLRKQHGSAKAGQMLYGPARQGVKAADRQAAIKRLAPGESKLPAAAQAAIRKELAASTPEEAFNYAAKAPNAQARDFFGEQLRQSILAQMKTR